MSQLNLVPTLRFTEFNSPWNLEKLGSFYTFKNGVNADKDQYGKGTKFINVLDVLQPYPITSDSIKGKVEVNEKTLEKNAVINGNLLFQRSSETREEVGTSNVYLGDRTVTFGGFVIRGTPVQQVNPIYMNYLLKSSKARKEIVTKSGGSTRYNVGQETLSSVSIIVSDVDDEQQKIADFLTTTDIKIGQLTEKHRLLKEYKKGVMQQIFSQQLRFKDANGNVFPDWGNKSLNQLASKITTKNKGRLVKVALTNSAKHGIMSQQDYFEKDIAKGDNTDNYCVVDINDFVYNPRISELAPVGPIGRNKIEKGVMSPLYSVFRFNPGICLDFIEYFFKGTTWHKYMHSVANFGARHDRMNISSADLMALPCPFPCVEEQKEIACFLQSIDSKVEGVAIQIKQTKQFKKGLLQQMFV
ncbi:restriction endonuclease subunit S [Vibrio lentus]|uniref:Restriction endonuclease subunit S n=1 Tax=Vibrio lentus TaxID=136468 RepID=A0A4U2ELC2_9VIBR|nr:restriction endonuclease subunit S [Vibrio lentus]TKG02122.1 restriction endonuclease subunit S [Vibrio lentus]